MKYKEYTIIEESDTLFINNVKDFNPVHIFECGQCFRWIKQKDGSYNGVAYGKAVNVSFSKDTLVIKNTNVKDFKNIWFNYFDLGRDYSQLKQILSKDPIMKEAINFGNGIRLLKQDIWETVISFIISSNNRIPRIMKIIEVISQTYGDAIKGATEIYYTFPEASRISDSGMEGLSVCKGGYRCKYIYLSSQLILNKAVLLKGLTEKTTDEARDELLKLPGVGPKVADCILLYSGTKYDVFPTDVWVKRVMEELYFKRDASFKEILEFSRKNFGEYAGIAQQYLFYYARENKIGIG